jgi:hypothetical protein
MPAAVSSAAAPPARLGESAEDLTRVAVHLDRSGVGSFAREHAMLGGIRQAMAEGRLLSEGQQNLGTRRRGSSTPLPSAVVIATERT